MFGRIYNWIKGRGFTFKFAVVALVAVIIFIIARRVSDPDESAPLRNNVVVFSLVYLNAIFLSLLAFLIGRNIVKLVFDRRNNILGARLRTRLVMAFAGIALVTNIILFVFAGGLLNNALTKFFSVQFEDAVNGAVDVAKIHYTSLKERAENSSRRVAKRISEGNYLQKQSEVNLKLEYLREQEGLFSVSIFDKTKTLVSSVSNAAALVESFQEPKVDDKAIDRALSGKPESLFEEKDAQSFIRSYRPLEVDQKIYILVTTYRISPEVSEALGKVNDTFREYKQTKSFKDPLRSGYMLTLSLITAVILFSAIWFGFYISKQLTTPIQVLADATNRVAKGDYETFIETIGDDEFGFLAQSFNRMTRELRSTRDEVLRRGQFIETILSRLGVAVLALDLKRMITQMNESSERLFNAGRHFDLPSDLESVIGKATLAKVAPLIKVMEEEDRAGGQAMIRESELTVNVEGEDRKLVCTVGSLNDSFGTRIGSIILFDDITEITKAQSMAVWREVARRIAHEIKNPLTPIKLSSQRLSKLVRTGTAPDAIIECADSIVQNVDSIAKLASEFSTFARMPNIEAKATSLNQLCREVLTSYRTSRMEIMYSDDLDESVPTMWLDPDQIKRALVNLFDNAIDAVVQAKVINPQVSLVTRHDAKSHNVTVEVSDNGLGILATDKARIFDPYFTTKKEGTGIGLGIVLSIIVDHGGTIRVFDNSPSGAKFVMTFPTQSSTQRKLSS